MPMIVSFIGLIGSGKSFSIDKLKDEIKKYNISVVSLSEQVDKWIKPYNYLKEIENKTPMKPIAQTYIFTTMLNQLTSATNFNGIVLQERGIHNSIFEFADDIDNPLTRHLFYELSELEKKLGVDLIINLKATVELCDQRIRDRNRSGELEEVTNTSRINYLNELNKKHLEYLSLAKYFAADKVIEIESNTCNYSELASVIVNKFEKLSTKL